MCGLKVFDRLEEFWSFLLDAVGDLAFRDLAHAFERVRSDAGHHLFGCVHVGAARNVSSQVDGVEVAAGRAEAAADAHVDIDDALAAAEAALRFDLDLVFGERET